MNHLDTPYTHDNIKDTWVVNKEFNKKVADTLKLSDVEKIFLAGNTQITCKADLAKIVEKPCLAVCEQLYDKNILTYWSSSNKESPDKAEVLIRYESLDEENKRIADDLSARGILSINPDIGQGFFDSWNTSEEYGPAVILRIKTNPNMTVNEISEQLCKIAMNFVSQDIKYNVYTPDYLSQYSWSLIGKHKTIFWFPSLQRTICGDDVSSIISPKSYKVDLYDRIRIFIDSRIKNWNKLSWEDMKKIADMIGRIYNNEDWFLYKDEETLRRHNEYKNNQAIE